MEPDDAVRHYRASCLVEDDTNNGDEDADADAEKGIGTAVCGLEAVVRHNNVAKLLQWVAKHNHRCVGILQEFLVFWCQHRHAAGTPLPPIERNLLASLIPFIINAKESDRLEAFLPELSAVRTQYWLTFRVVPSLPVVPVASVCSHSAQQVCIALKNNIVAQFKRTVLNALKLYIPEATAGTEQELVSTTKAINMTAYAVANHLLASQLDFDAATYAPWVLGEAEPTVTQRLWTAVRAQPWVANIRRAATTLRIFKAQYPVVFFVKKKPLTYLPVLMGLNALIIAHVGLGGRKRNGTFIKPLRLFPIQSSEIPDFFRIDYSGMRDTLVRHCPNALPRVGPDAECRNGSATATPRMAHVVWNTVLRMNKRPLCPAKAGASGVFTVMGASIMTDGASMRVQRVRCQATPVWDREPICHMPILPNADAQFKLNLTATSLKMTTDQLKETKTGKAQHLLQAPPPQPPTHYDAETSGISMTAAERHARDWRVRATAQARDDPERAVSLATAAAWAEIQDAALSTDPPEYQDKDSRSVRQMKLIAKAWNAKADETGPDTAFCIAQKKAWTTCMNKMKAQTKKQTASTSMPDLTACDPDIAPAPTKRQRVLAPTSAFETEVQVVVDLAAPVPSCEAGVAKAKKEPEFGYVHHLPHGYVKSRYGSDVRLVGIDPNKGTLMHCCEVREDVDGTINVGLEDEPVHQHRRDHGVTWFRHTQKERRFATKSRYLAEQRELALAIAKTSTSAEKAELLRRSGLSVHARSSIAHDTAPAGVDVKALEDGLRGVSTKAMDITAFTAYLVAKHDAQAAGLTRVYEDMVFRRLRWQGFRAKQRADDALVKRFAAKFGGPETTAICWGDWSEHGREGSTHMRFHEPTRGIGLRRLFRRHGYAVWLVDEDFTSKRCHDCKVGDCAPFRQVKNPRVSSRASRPTTPCWGLTRCDHCGMLWDRDANSALNILWAAKTCLLSGSSRPIQLTRAWKSHPTYLNRCSD